MGQKPLRVVHKRDLHHISLQIEDRNVIQKQKTANLKEILEKMKNGRLSEEIAEAISTQNKLKNRRKVEKEAKHQLDINHQKQHSRVTAKCNYQHTEGDENGV